MTSEISTTKISYIQCMSMPSLVSASFDILYILKFYPSSPVQGECDDSSYGESFKYDALKDELVVGEIYVRVFNEQPTFVLEV